MTALLRVLIRPLLVEHSSVAVVLKVPLDMAAGLTLPDGEKAENLHLTVMMLGKVNAISPAAKNQIVGLLQSFAQTRPPVEGVVSGIGRFATADDDDGKDAVIATFDSQMLDGFRRELLDLMTSAGFPQQTQHGFTPHITVKYVGVREPTPDLIPEKEVIRFSTMELWYGWERIPFKLAGTVDPEARDDRRSRGIMASKAFNRAEIEGVLEADEKAKKPGGRRQEGEEGEFQLEPRTLWKTADEGERVDALASAGLSPRERRGLVSKSWAEVEKVLGDKAGAVAQELRLFRDSDREDSEAGGAEESRRRRRQEDDEPDVEADPAKEPETDEAPETGESEAEDPTEDSKLDALIAAYKAAKGDEDPEAAKGALEQILGFVGDEFEALGDEDMAGRVREVHGTEPEAEEPEGEPSDESSGEEPPTAEEIQEMRRRGW